MAEDSENRTDGQKITDKAKQLLGWGWGGGAGELDDWGGGGSVSRFIQVPKMQTAISDTTLVGGGGAGDWGGGLGGWHAVGEEGRGVGGGGGFIEAPNDASSNFLTHYN